MLRSEDQTTTAGTATTTATTTTPTAVNNTSPQPNNVSERKSSVSEDDVLDENKEPPPKRLRTRASAAALNHQ